ncbi:hypothetical protein [Bremerella sp. P1]|uniref:hypothetical protein n=1 Tax=Bremerella sp. P1 TaxID=3026424 RepID=UPI0023679FDA|nr:hypothetical protein [Bremerella sp. P1]WDI42998.1 hypothetical protein PSR63_03440 [Bremerella sp. P1]
MSDENSPSKKRGCLAVFGLLVSTAYLANLSGGFIEIPDNIPGIGNLDEVFFSGIFFASLAQLGISLPFMEGKGRSIRESRKERESDDVVEGKVDVTDHPEGSD